MVVYLNRLVLTLVLAGGYVCVTAATVRDETLLLPGLRLTLPVFGTPAEVGSFLLLAPALIVVMHGYLLAERGRFIGRIYRLWPEGLPQFEARRLFVPLSLYRDGHDNWFRRWVRPSSLILMVLVLLPPALLLFLQFRFLPYRDPDVASWLRFCVLADLALLLIHLWGSARFAFMGKKFRRLAVVLLCFVELLLLGLLARMAIVEYAPLPSRGEQSPETIGSRHLLDLAGWEPEAPQELSLAKRDLRYADFSGAQLNGIDFRGADLSHADFSGASLDGAQFGPFEGQPALLYRTVFDDAHLRSAVLDHATLRHASLRRTDLTAASLVGTDLRWADLSDASLPLAVMTQAMMERVEAPRVDLFAADLSDASLTGANLEHGNLQLVVLSRARVRGLRLFAAAAGGVDFPVEGDGMDLRRACLQGARPPALVWLDLRYARLAGADLRASLLVTHVDLRGIDYQTTLDAQRIQFRLDQLLELPSSAVPKVTIEGRVEAARERLLAAQGRELEVPKTEEGLNLVLRDPDPNENRSSFPDDLAAFQYEWARQMTHLGCRNAFLADAFVRRAAGLYRPRDRSLEEKLATALAARWGKADCAQLNGVNPALWGAFCDEWEAELSLKNRCQDVAALISKRGLTLPAPASPPAPSAALPPPCPPRP